MERLVVPGKEVCLGLHSQLRWQKSTRSQLCFCCNNRQPHSGFITAVTKAPCWLLKATVVQILADFTNPMTNHRSTDWLHWSTDWPSILLQTISGEMKCRSTSWLSYHRRRVGNGLNINTSRRSWSDKIDNCEPASLSRKELWMKLGLAKHEWLIKDSKRMVSRHRMSVLSYCMVKEIMISLEHL